MNYIILVMPATNSKNKNPEFSTKFVVRIYLVKAIFIIKGNIRHYHFSTGGPFITVSHPLIGPRPD